MTHLKVKNYTGIFVKAEKALKEAVRGAIKDHVRTGDPMYFWKNGRVVKVSAARLLKGSA